MPRDSDRTPQLQLFVHDPAASPEALARYETIRPVLKGERSLRQQSQRTGIPLARLVELEPTPPTPNRGKGGPRPKSTPPPEDAGSSGNSASP